VYCQILFLILQAKFTNSKMALYFIDLFAGASGLSKGFIRAGSNQKSEKKLFMSLK